MINGKLISKHSPDSSKMFHVVVPTYKGGAMLEVIINCFIAQSSQNFHLSIISDGQELETKTQLERYFDIENFSYYQLDERYNDWGHSPREFGLLQSDCKYTIMTGFDNYYVPLFIERFEGGVTTKPNVGFVFCDLILDYRNHARKYRFKDSQLAYGQIDIGNFAANTQLIKEVGFKSRVDYADWVLVDKLLPILKQRNYAICKIPEVLYIHN